MKHQTTVTTVDMDSLDEFFPDDVAESVIVPEENKPTIFSQEPAFDIDEDEPEEVPAAAAPEETADILSFDELVESAEEDNARAGRSKKDKSGIVELYKKKIESGDMVPFDDYKEDTDLTDYLSELSMKDLEDLWDANETRKRQDIEEKVPQEFFESLPRELQFAAKYVHDGGTDLKSLFKALAQVEEVRELDPETHGKEVAYQYLKATNFGTEEEINEQVAEWEDLGVVEKKAKGFKPKLDKMQEQIVQQQLVHQEQQRVQREQAAQQYIVNVQESLKEPELAGMKLDKKTHQFLIQGLLQPAYPSITGKPTNLLGHLLEKHQIVEPNHQLVAEALYLLSDPEGYRTKIREQAAAKTTQTIVRALKTEQSRQIGSSPAVTYNNKTGQAKRATVPRTGSIFKR